MQQQAHVGICLLRGKHLTMVCCAGACCQGGAIVMYCIACTQLQLHKQSNFFCRCPDLLFSSSFGDKRFMPMQAYAAQGVLKMPWQAAAV